ncbi:uncharacterized protein VTP21DRAFT_5582 [Calcarisporiella thermophila]|uniref:uncharacterized protein n=1 Tax=Calcarisporiella thermophila TaxID=911321 RepID=UPI0037438B77
MTITTSGRWFIESTTGRILLLRGVNLPCKSPRDLPSLPGDKAWQDHDRHVSYVGMPFPLEEADEHFKRLRDMGWRVVRFCVCWEAIEHEAPGVYDEEYLEYVVKMLEKARDYGLRVFIDPHQDMWSRHCGGSGAPGWILTLIGFNPENFQATQAAITQSQTQPEEYLPMVWTTNAVRLATCTIFTLFFAGSIYAPLCIVDGVNIQEYLQRHFLDAILVLAKRIHDAGMEDVVLGYDTLNEPLRGYVNHTDLRLPKKTLLNAGLMPTPFQSMLLGQGFTTDHVEKWNPSMLIRRTSKVTIDPHGLSAWDISEDVWTRRPNTPFPPWEKSPQWKRGTCLWAQHGVWDPVTRTLLRPDYFARHPETSAPVDWLNDCLRPFLRRYVDALHSIDPQLIIFLQTAPTLDPVSILSSEETQIQQIAYAPHYYEVMSLMSKQWRNWTIDFVDYFGDDKRGLRTLLKALRWGENAVRGCIAKQVEYMIKKVEGLGEYPVLFGEVGIPFDLKDSKNSEVLLLSSPQSRAMDAVLCGMDANLASYTIWNYCAENTLERGDWWNDEDFSVFQRANGSTENARDLLVLHRAYPMKLSGSPISFSLTFSPVPEAKLVVYGGSKFPTEVFLPKRVFPSPVATDLKEEDMGLGAANVKVQISDGWWQVLEEEEHWWILGWWADQSHGKTEHWLHVMGVLQQ